MLGGASAHLKPDDLVFEAALLTRLKRCGKNSTGFTARSTSCVTAQLPATPQ
jgi:hypothetical protein